MTVDARGIKATFERDGVYLARGVFDAATIDRLAADFDRIVAQLIESRESIDATWTTADRSTAHVSPPRQPGSRGQRVPTGPTYDPERHMAFQT